MKNCRVCGNPIPNRQDICSMCFGDVEYGTDNYYRDWIERQDKELQQKEQLREIEEKLESGDEPMNE